MDRMNNHNYSATEVGRILLNSLVYDVAHLNVIDDDLEPPCTQEEFREIERTLSGEKELSIYQIYTALHKGIVASFNRGAGHLTNKFINGIREEIELIKLCESAEKCLSYIITNTPFCVPDSRRKRLFEKAAKSKRQTLLSIGEIVLDVIQYFTNHEDEVPDYLKAPLLKIKDQPVRNKAIIKNYTYYEDLWYYVLPDKTKVSQNAKDPFWGSALHSMILNEINSKDAIRTRQQLIYEGPQAVQQRYTEMTGKRITSKRAALLYDDLIRAYDDSIEFKACAPYRIPTQEHDKLFVPSEHIAKKRYFTHLPKEITMYTILQKKPESLLYASGSDSSKQAIYDNIEAEIPELWAAAIRYVEENLIIEDAILDIRSNLDVTLTLEYLARHNFLDYSEKAKATTFDLLILYSDTTYDDFVICEEIRNNGVSVLYGDKDFSEKRRYDQIDVYENLPINIDKVYKGALSRISFRRKKEMILSPYNYIAAFNVLMDVLAYFVFTPELQKLKIDETRHIEYIEKYNRAIYSLYSSVVGNRAEKKRKREIIKSLFQPIDIELECPSIKAQNQVIADLEKLSLKALIEQFSNLDGLIMKLSEGRSELY